MQINNEHYFIEFANYTAKDIEKIYEGFPKEILDKPENWPKLETPIEANLHSLLWACREANMCPIPDRMIVFAQSFQQSLKNILDGIIMTQGQVHESDELNFIINLQERIITKYEFIDGQLVGKTIPNPDDQGKIMITPGWLKYSCRSLLDYLCEGKPKQLKKCPYCKKFFVAKDSKRKRSCYSTNCIKKWERDKKQDQREKDPVKYI